MLMCVNRSQLLRSNYSTIHRKLVKLCCWNSSVQRFSTAHDAQESPGPNRRSGTRDAFKHGSLTVDTKDRDGNVAIPLEILQVMPRLEQFLRGDAQRGVMSQNFEQQVRTHRTAVEQAKQWFESVSQEDVQTKELLEEWKQQHVHWTTDGRMKARWLSINVDPAAAGPTDALSIGFRKDGVSQGMRLLCHTGVLPMREGISLEDAGAAFEVELPALNFSAESCDAAHGSWRSYLVLLSEDASFFDHENMWPNFMCHGARTLHKMTASRAVAFMADPTVSEISKHVRNMARHGESDILEYLIQRWGKDTLIELCERDARLCQNLLYHPCIEPVLSHIASLRACGSMRLAVHLNENNVKQVKNFLTCCAKLGTVLLIEASTNKMCWRIINSAKSACLMITLQSQLFEHYLLYEVSLMTASVLLKHLLAAFRTPKIKSLELEIVDHDVLTIVVHSESGLMKRYQVACVEEEHLAASIDRNQLPTTITADAFQLHKVLSSFQNTLDEVSLIVRPQSAQTQGNQHIRMASYNGSGKARKGKTLNTIINIDVKGGQLFKSSVLRSNDTMEATFNIKDFTVIVSLCKALHADVMLNMGTPGTPLLVEAANMGFANSMDAVEAELLLATVAEYVQDDLPEAPAEAAAATPSRVGGLRQGNPTPMSAGGVATPGTLLPPDTIRHHAMPARDSPPQDPHQHQPGHPHHQPTQAHDEHTFQTQRPAAASQQPLPAAPSTTARTPSNMQTQHPQAAHASRVLDTHAPQGLQHNNAFSAIPETALGTTAPDLRGVRAPAVLATPPNFNMAGRQAMDTVQADATTPALLDPPALTYQPQTSPAGAAAVNPSQPTQPQQDPPSGEPMAPSFRVPTQLAQGAGGTQDGACMHDNNANAAQHDPLTLRLPALPRNNTTEAIPAHCADVAHGGFGMSSWSDLRGDSPGSGMASISNVGQPATGQPQDYAGIRQSQQVAAGATQTVSQQEPAVNTGSMPHYSDDPGAIPGGDQQESDAADGAEHELPLSTCGADENQGGLHNTAIAQYTQHGSVSRSLVRLAEIIKQDERARQAGGSAQQWGAAANQVETVNMHVAGDHLDDEEQALEDADGEFAADDWECLATPPEERPDTFFD